MALRRPCKHAFVVYLLSLVFFLVSFGSPYWLWMDAGSEWTPWADEPTDEVSIGLWQACLKRKSKMALLDCQKIHTSLMPKWYRYAVWFMILALVPIVLAFFTQMFMPVAAGFQIAAGLLTLTATCIYGIGMADVFKDDDYIDKVPLGWAFIFGVIAGFLFLLNGIVLAARARGDMTSTLCANQQPGRGHVDTTDVQMSGTVAPSTAYGEPAPTYAGRYEKDSVLLVTEA